MALTPQQPSGRQVGHEEGLQTVPAGCREVEELSVEERAKAAVLIGVLFESSALVRADFSDKEEEKKELYRQRQDLRIKAKKLALFLL